MIEMRRAQLSFGDGLIAAEVSDLREPWMAHADAVLADEGLVAVVFEALGKRRPQSRCAMRKIRRTVATPRSAPATRSALNPPPSLWTTASTTG